MMVAPGEIDGAETDRLMTQVSELRAANGQLQTTIDHLRRELEDGVAAMATAVQQARADQAVQQAQLQDTIKVMREQMDAEIHAAQAVRQAGLATADGEAQQLRGTIVGLRDELERVRQQAVHDAAQEAAAFAKERAGLQQQIIALRAQFEARQ